MSVRYLNQNFFYGGIAPSEKVGIKGSFYFGQRLNIFDEPTRLTIMPKSIKVSGVTVTDLIKWIVAGTPYDTNMYFYSEGGLIYRETNAGVWNVLRTVANSNGQGMEIHGDYLYYTQNTQIGRYGPLSGTPTFTDNWQTGLNDTSLTRFAPIKAFKEGLAVGHGNYLAWWDGSVWQADRLVLPPGLQIRSLEVVDEFLVIGTWRGTSINANEEGYLFFWDGSSTTFNNFVKIPQGGCAALLNNKNRLISVVGGNGQILMNYSPFLVVQTVPKLTVGNYVDIYPGAVTNWRGLAQIGVSGATDSPSIVQGVYTYGSLNQLYPEVLNYSFTISTGTISGTGLKIGALYGKGNNLYIAWGDGTSYGVDKVTNSNDPYASAVFESLIFDHEALYKDKLAMKLKATHLPLAPGESVQLGYKVNRASSYITGDANTTVGSTETTLSIPASDARFKEIQFEVILATTGSTSPTVTYVGLEFDELADELQF